MVFYVSSNKHCLCKISITCLKTAVKWPWHHNECVNLVTSQTNVFTTWWGELVAPVHDNAVKFNVMLTVLMWCMTPNTPCKGPITWHALTAWKHWWTRFLYEIFMRIVHLKDKAERISAQGIEKRHFQYFVNVICYLTAWFQIGTALYRPFIKFIEFYATKS